MNKNIKALEKLEEKQLNKLNKCKQTKCAALYKQKTQENKKFVKEQAKVCNQKDSDAYYNCTTKFYNNSKLQKISNEFVDCGNKKCIKDKNILNSIREEMNSLYTKTPEIVNTYIKKIIGKW